MPKRQTTKTNAVGRKGGNRKQSRAVRKEELKKTGYKSWFEVEVADVLKAMGQVVDYEPERIPYVIPETVRHYTPDWKLRDKVFCETKGVLDLATRKKLLHFKDSNPDVKIYLLFENASNKIKSGSKTSYGEWASKHGFEWADWKYGFPIGWLTGENKE